MRFRPPPPSHVSGLLSPSWQTSLYVICVAQATAMLAFGFVLPFLPLYLKEIGVSPESAVVFWSGALVTSTGLSLAIFSPIWCALPARAVRIRGTCFVAGAMLAIAGVFVWQFVHEHFSPPSIVKRPGFIETVGIGLRSPILMPLMVTLLLVQLSSAIVFPILPLFVERLSSAQHPVKLYAGLAFGATAAFSALAALFYSRLVDRSGYRRILILACFGAALFFLPQAFVRNIGQFLLLRAGLGIFFGVLIPATNAIVGLSTPPELRGSAYGLTSSATAVGNAVGPLLGSTLAASLGFPAVFIATAGVLTLLGVWVIGLVREPVAHPPP